MEPTNYNIDVATPFASAIQGYQAGAAIRNDQQQQVQLQKQQAIQLQQQQMLSSLANNPNATGNDYARVMTSIPSLAEPLTKAWSARNSDQQQSTLSDLAQWGSAIKSGQPEIVTDQMNRRADAMEKVAGGQTPESQALRAQAQVVTAHPQFALGLIQAKLAAHPDGTKTAGVLASLGAESRASAEAPFDLAKKTADASKATTDAQYAGLKAATDINNTVSQINDRSGRLGLDRDALTSKVQMELAALQQKNGELPEDVRKSIDTSTTDSIASQQSAEKMTDLATKLDAEGGGYGAFSTAGEWIKRATGNQNEMTRLRAEYNRIATPAAMAAYKKVASGSTSDKDIETAMVGVPKDNADAATMASFLRGAAKLQTYNSVIENAKSEWFGANRTLGKLARDATIDGVQVPAGMSFKNFSDAYVERKVKEKTNDATIKAAPYAAFANPAPAQPPAAAPAEFLQ